jgi:hypothetical protein
MDLTPETAHLVISVGTGFATVGGIYMMVKDLKRAFYEHVKSDDKRHDEQEDMLREHDREIVKIASQLDVSGIHHVGRPRGGE